MMPLGKYAGSVERAVKVFYINAALGGGDVLLCIETSHMGWRGKAARGLPVSLSGFIIGQEFLSA